MAKLLKDEFTAARTALLDAATAVDAKRFKEAEEHLRTLQAVCEIILELLRTVPGSGRARYEGRGDT